MQGDVENMQDKYDIIIQGGQSNADGSGLGPVIEEYIPSPQILYLNAKKQVEEAKEGIRVTYIDEPFVIEEAKERENNGNKVGDFALTFAEAYVKNGHLAKGRKVLIVRGGIGGTGFYKHHWGLQDNVYLKMLEMTDYALHLNPENRIVAFLWHQGEHDAFEGNTAETYYSQLSDMLRGVRTRYGMVPFIAGDFVKEFKNQFASEHIVKSIRRVAQENERTAFVETSDLLSNNQVTKNEDIYHFSRESLHILGRRYYHEFAQIHGDK